MARFNLSSAAMNTAILDQLLNLTKTQKLLSGAVFGFSSMFDIVKTQKPEVQKQSTASTSSKPSTDAAANMMLTASAEQLAQIDTLSKELNELAGNTDALNNLFETLNKDHLFTEKEAKKYANGIKHIIDTVIASANKAEKNEVIINKLTDFFVAMKESLTEFNDGIGKSMMGIAATMLALGASIAIVSTLGSVQGLLLFTGAMLSFIGLLKVLNDMDQDKLTESANTLLKVSAAVGLLGLALLPFKLLDVGTLIMTGAAMLTFMGTMLAVHKISNLMNKGQDSMSGGVLLSLAGSIGIFGLALLAFEFVSIKGLLTATAAMFVLAGAITLISLALKIGGTNKDGLSVSVLGIAASMGVLALSLWAFSKLITSDDMIWQPVVAMIGITAGLALAMRIAGGSSGAKDLGMGVFFMSAAIGVLALSIALWRALDLQATDLIMPGLAIIGLATALALVSKIGGDNIIKASVAMGVASIVVGLLALSVLAWKVLGLTPADLITPGIAIIGLAAALTIAGMLHKQVLKGALALGIGGLVVGGLAYAVNMWKDYGLTTWESVKVPVLFITGLGLAIAGLGLMGPQALMGAGALLMAGLGIAVIGFGVSKMAAVSGEQLLNIGLFVAGIGLAVAGLGVLGPVALMGAGALLLTGVGLLVMGNAVAKFPANSGAIMLEMAGGLTVLSAAVALIGNPFTLIPLGLGIIAVGGMGLATLAFAHTLTKIKEARVTKEDSEQVVEVLDYFIGGMAGSIKRNSSNLKSAEDGIAQASGLGSLMKDMADGIAQMANLNFVEYEVQNGRLVPKSVRQLTDNDFKLAGEGMGKIITALTGPLSAIGDSKASTTILGFKFKNPFAGNKVAKGIDALMGVGEIFAPLIDSVKLFKEQNVDSAFIEEYTGNLSLLLNGMAEALGTANFDDTKKAKEAAKNFERITNSLSSMELTLTSDRFKKLSELRETIETLLHKNTADALRSISTTLADDLTPVLEKLSDVLESLNGVNVPDIKVNSTVTNAQMEHMNTGQKIQAMGNNILSEIKDGINELSDLIRSQSLNSSSDY